MRVLVPGTSEAACTGGFSENGGCGSIERASRIKASKGRSGFVVEIELGLFGCLNEDHLALVNLDMDEADLDGFDLVSDNLDPCFIGRGIFGGGGV